MTQPSSEIRRAFISVNSTTQVESEVREREVVATFMNEILFPFINNVALEEITPHSIMSLIVHYQMSTGQRLRLDYLYQIALIILLPRKPISEPHLNPNKGCDH